MTLLWILAWLTFIGTGYAFPTVIPGYGKIIGGGEVLPHSWPWQASLHDSTGFYFCSGSLINLYWVLTAAHCNVRTSTRVVLGAQYLSSNAQSIQTLPVAKVFTSPTYNPSTLSNDIALIKLASPAQLSNNVSPVCLPETSDNFPPGTSCVTSGRTRYNAGNTPDHLQQAALRLVTIVNCPLNWSSDLICAEASSCMVDSGGPLACQKSGVWTLAGVATWGSSICSSATPGVYTRVSKFRTWIDRIIAAN
ncbi:chymotrypsinogen 2-like isoform X2 [Colossoma macropomum]|uniref:chymotrypsinogen 2-like isoform X2 n=1 Tax=Colossoma macropomum TaxID=42526 RepID=UPI0018654E46|nr:chymotrypsinogen 2-like isoform X2 [Colossoma macropomum]